MSDGTFNLGHVLNSFFRAYIPDLEVRQATFYQQTTTVAKKGLSVNVNPSFSHRKIWVHLNSGGNITNRWQLVATLNKTEVFRWQMTYWNTLNAPQYFMNYGVAGTNIGLMGEQLFIKLGGSISIAISPMVLNIACDTISLDASAISDNGTGPLWDGYLFTMSKPGV